jgi:hypothetical protein
MADGRTFGAKPPRSGPAFDLVVGHDLLEL